MCFCFLFVGLVNARNVLTLLPCYVCFCHHHHPIQSTVGLEDACDLIFRDVSLEFAQK